MNTNQEPIPVRPISARLHKLLDEAEKQLESLNTMSAFSLLGPELNICLLELRDNYSEPDIKAACQQHPVFDLVMQDPYSARAFNKPRGFAGDAVMLDLVYDGQPPEGTSAIGRTVFAGTAGGPMGRSVAFRKALLRASLQATCFQSPTARVLSVAGGHCREIAGTPFMKADPSDAGARWEFCSIDQDPLSCEKVRADHSSTSISVECASIVDLFDADFRDRLGKFDFIYSAGLFDYLKRPLAARLCSVLSSLLADQGRLLLANFTPDCFGRAFMELFLDWSLVYRTPKELEALGKRTGLTCTDVSLDPFGNVAYASWETSPSGPASSDLASKS